MYIEFAVLVLVIASDFFRRQLIIICSLPATTSRHASTHPVPYRYHLALYATLGIHVRNPHCSLLSSLENTS